MSSGNAPENDTTGQTPTGEAGTTAGTLEAHFAYRIGLNGEVLPISSVRLAELDRAKGILLAAIAFEERLEHLIENVKDYEREVLDIALGQVIRHGVRYPLMYHAEIAGDTWPGVDDLEAERLDGRPALTAAQRFTRDYAEWSPHYFVVTDMDSLNAQRDLQALLAEKATLVDETARHRVYKFH